MRTNYDVSIFKNYYRQKCVLLKISFLFKRDLLVLLCVVDNQHDYSQLKLLLLNLIERALERAVQGHKNAISEMKLSLMSLTSIASYEKRNET